MTQHVAEGGPPSLVARADQVIEYPLVDLDARGRRLRAALAAVLVPVCLILALICAERTRQARRFQSSSAPRVLLSPRG
jgi:hypothetical protein